MKKFTRLFSITLLTGVLFWGSGCFLNEPIYHTYLTWMNEDTATTMAIHYQTDRKFKKAQAFVDTRSHGGSVEKFKKHAERVHGTSRFLKKVKRFTHTIQLTGLTPNTTYYFIVGDRRSGFSKEFKFKTLPDDDTPIRFINGGDMGTSRLTAKLGQKAAAQNPDVALIGGDIAYVNGELDDYKDWDKWLFAWEKIMVDQAKHLVPMILAIGNHETNTDIPMRRPFDRAPFFLRYFPQTEDDKTYFVRRLGKNAVVFVLDSGHIHRHDGKQKKWLEEQLKRFQDVKFKIAMYHIPLYPSHRRFSEDMSRAGRKHWAPLFDQYGLTVAFEHHDHTFKRTYKIYNGKKAKKNGPGTIYLGDGSFGKSPREPRKNRWFLEKANGNPHFWRGDISSDQLEAGAYDSSGKRFDRVIFE